LGHLVDPVFQSDAVCSEDRSLEAEGVVQGEALGGA